MELNAPSPFSFVLFGASGHLATLKIYPALYFLALKKRFPSDYAIVGFARSEMDDKSFRALVEESLRSNIPEVNEGVVKEFLSHVYYVKGQYDSKDDFAALAKRLSEIEKGWKKTVRLAYLSVPPMVFPDVLVNLCAGGVHDHKNKNAFRCIVEKPVGHDLKSFEEVQKQLTNCFTENEIYLLDHYLGKEAVRNIYYLRFSNPVLERLFKNTLIHHVEVTASEAAGLEGRAGYFEHVGTFRDMFQSHLLMMISLLTMRLEGDTNFRDSRMNALEQFYLPPAGDLSEIALQGQYTKGKTTGEQERGYLEEEGVTKNSRTNTYCALKLLTRISKWQGVPFYLRSGKRLRKKETRISLEFQEPHTVGTGSTPNRLDIILQGEAGMKLYLQTKVGGTEPAFRPLVMEDPLVCVGDCLPEHSLLLLEAIHGKQQWFLTFEEVRTAWKLVDPVQKYLEKQDTPLHTYPAGSTGPKEADKWIEGDGTTWFS